MLALPNEEADGEQGPRGTEGPTASLAVGAAIVIGELQVQLLVAHAERRLAAVNVC